MESLCLCLRISLSLCLSVSLSLSPSVLTAIFQVNQLRLGRQRQVWLIPIADERVGVQVKL